MNFSEYGVANSKAGMAEVAKSKGRRITEREEALKLIRQINKHEQQVL